MDHCTPTNTATSSSTTTPTPTPTFITTLIGHVNWEARLAQPSQRQVLPITLTLKSGATELDYPTQQTDQYGFFTVTLGVLPGGTYNWRADDTSDSQTQHPPNYLANAGVVLLGGEPLVSVEMGLMRAGDANNDNVITTQDFSILKSTFGKSIGQQGYDSRADFTGDGIANTADFNPLRNNFGHSGAPPIAPPP